MKIREHDRVVLTVDLPNEAFVAGDVGVVVHIHNDGEAYEVEFMTFSGETLALATLQSSQIRPIGERDVYHARKLAAG